MENIYNRKKINTIILGLIWEKYFPGGNVQSK